MRSHQIGTEGGSMGSQLKELLHGSRHLDKVSDLLFFVPGCNVTVNCNLEK